MPPRWETVGEVTFRGRFRLEWIVDESYFLSPRVGDYVGSPTFQFANSLWYVAKWPYGWSGPLDFRWIGLGLCGTSSQGPVLNVRLGLKKLDGQNLKSSWGKTNPCGSFEQPRFIKTWQMQKRIAEVSDNGRITIFLELSIETIPPLFPRPAANASLEIPTGDHNANDVLSLSEGAETAAEEVEFDKAEKLKSESFDKLLLDLKALMSNEDCDITFRVRGKEELSAHKLILAARCPVFRSMFKHQMVEETSGVVEIEDCDPESFRDLLFYLYTGAVESMSRENVFGLFAAADKYCLDELRNECLEFVRTSLCVDTFCETVELSLRYAEAELLEQATEFFAKHMKEIIVVDKWESFLHENTAEGNKLFVKALVPKES